MPSLFITIEGSQLGLRFRWSDDGLRDFSPNVFRDRPCVISERLKYSWNTRAYLRPYPKANSMLSSFRVPSGLKNRSGLNESGLEYISSFWLIALENAFATSNIVKKFADLSCVR